MFFVVTSFSYIIGIATRHVSFYSLENGLSRVSIIFQFLWSSTFIVTIWLTFVRTFLLQLLYQLGKHIIIYTRFTNYLIIMLILVYCYIRLDVRLISSNKPHKDNRKHNKKKSPYVLCRQTIRKERWIATYLSFT